MSRSGDSTPSRYGWRVRLRYQTEGGKVRNTHSVSTTRHAATRWAAEMKREGHDACAVYAPNGAL